MIENKNEGSSDSSNIDFDLPEVEGTVAPRIHRSPGDSTCESCEG